MINVRKGTAHSLLQTDVVGAVTVNASRTEAKTTGGNASITAGMFCQKNTSGNIELITTCTTAADYGQLGFAVNNGVDGDVIETGKVGLYLLDGGSVIETDQVTTSLTVGSESLNGLAVVADGSTAGKVKAVAHGSVSTSRVLGTVFGAPRVIYVGQTPTTVLPIKLSAGAVTLT